jgi:hypothetical protein
MGSLEPFIYYANSVDDFPLLNTDANGHALDTFDAGVPRFPDTHSVLRGTIQQTQRLFSSLADSEPIEGPLVVFGDSCDLRDTAGQARNCTRACSDPYLLYATWESQWTCLTLASMAVAWPTVSLNDSVEAAVAGVFGILDGSVIDTFDGRGVFEAIRSCGMVGCQDDSCVVDYSSSRNESDDSPDGDTVTDVPVLLPYLNGLWHVCNNVRVTVSNDISGPGVSQSATPSV